MNSFELPSDAPAARDHSSGPEALEDADAALVRLQQMTARRADELARNPGHRHNDLALWLEAEIQVLSELRRTHTE